MKSILVFHFRTLIKNKYLCKYLKQYEAKLLQLFKLHQKCYQKLVFFTIFILSHEFLLVKR